MVKRLRPHALVLIALLAIGVSGWHESLRNALTDLRVQLDQRAASGDVVVVAIDAHSIERIGVWPWPRALHAELLRRLHQAGAQDIAFDVDFSAPSDPPSDQTFGEALQAAGGATILPTFKQHDAGGAAAPLHVNRPLPQFLNNAWTALVNVEIAADGRVRRYAYGQRLDGVYEPAMATLLAGHTFASDASFLIDFGIDPATIPAVSFVDVITGEPATLARLKDKKVIVGGTALELGDRFSVPNGRIVSGPVLQALATESILQHRDLRNLSELPAMAAIAALTLAMLACWRRLSVGRRALLLVATSALAEAIAMLAHARFAIVFDTSLLQVAILAYVAAIALDEINFRGLLGRIAENRFQRIAMSLGEGLVCADRERRITVWNPGATAIFGYEADEMIGQPFDRLCANSEEALLLLAEPDSAQPVALATAGLAIEFQGRRNNGELFPAEATVSAWQGADGLHYGAILRDISLRNREAARIRYLAEHDALTGLVNRSTFLTRLTAMMAAPNSERGGVALLVIGLDGFQQVNDMLGHATGDEVLQALASRLDVEIDGIGIVARLSGDEFAIAIPCGAIGSTVAEFADHLARIFEVPLQAGVRQHRAKVSIGVAVSPDAGRSADELLSNGHLAFCRAKADRRCSYVLFEDQIRKELEARLTLEAELVLALERREFELFYQPQVKLTDGSLVGAEALIRWRHPVRGLVPPSDFIPLVNTSTISDAVGSWVMETACRQARLWERAGHAVRVGINLSPSQLRSGDLPTAVGRLLEATGLSPQLLELEVTEDILLHHEPRVLDIFNRLQALGVSLVFDDFGTGYASLSYLKKFPLDGLKIDRSFVSDLLTDPDDAAIVGSTVRLSHQLGLSVIAEGIENQATADFLLRLGCEHGQGYFYGKPMPAREFESRFMASPEPAANPQQRGAA